MFGKNPTPKETPSVEKSVGAADLGHIANNGSDGELGQYDELGVRCPAHTSKKALKAKIDLHVLPFVILLYLAAFLDRINVANGKSFSMLPDLGINPKDPKGLQYNTLLTIFFVPYILFEVPSNILLNRFSPRIWLSICCLGFGLVTTLQGLTQNYSGILATRFFLGVFECGMFPGCFYLLSMWYKRAESQKRYSLFFQSTSLAGAFGGLLASAIGKMDGIRGYHGWRWIFILEGIVTFLIGVVFLFTFPSFPEEAKWLREDERAYIKARLRADQGNNAHERPISFTDFFTVMKDYKIWLGGLMYFGCIIPAYGYAYFSTTILSTYHYSAIETQLRSVPPWASAFGFGMLIAFASDRVRHRFLFALVPILLAIAGFAILLNVHDNINLEYASLFLICMGTFSAMPVIVCWFNMNLAGHHRRAIGTAWQIGFGNIGGFISTYSFLQSDAPFYRNGYRICIAFLCVSAASVIAYAASVVWENRRKNKAVRDVGMRDYEKTELGDLNPDFRYML